MANDLLKPLNFRQASFVELYLSNGANGTQAALDAGYKESGAANIAYKLLRWPDFAHVQHEIKRRQQEIAVRTGATPESVNAKIWDTMTKAHAALEEPILDDQGNTIGFLFNHNNAKAVVSAGAELNKTLGNHAVVRHRIDANVKQQLDVKSILSRRRRQLEAIKKQKETSPSTDSPENP